MYNLTVLGKSLTLADIDNVFWVNSINNNTVIFAHTKLISTWMRA